MGDLLYKKETHQLRGLIYQVRNELKAGWPEAVYHQALVRVLQNAQIPVVSKNRHALFHRNAEIHVFGLIVNFDFKQLQIFGVNSTTSKNPRFLLSESYKQKKAVHE